MPYVVVFQRYCTLIFSIKVYNKIDFTRIAIHQFCVQIQLD